MPIIGYNISSISAERENVRLGKIDISSASMIRSVEERSVGMPRKQKVLAVGFEFKTVYKPDLGQIKIVGELLYAGKLIAEALKQWKKKRRLPEDVDIEVKNFLFRRCLSLGVVLSEQLQLPPPVMFPVLVKKDEEKTKYIG